MTIFHLIKYNPEEVTNTWLNTTKPWIEIVPPKVGDKIFHRILTAGLCDRQIVDAVREELLKYDGDL